MRYSHGAPCSGDLHRSTDVKLFCGKEDRFLSIKERKRCFYEIDFETPYVCPKPSEASEELFIHSEL
ncbi:hypothetical protein Zmor_027053 [Zophobas morio]|uniref:MRH domain-containing protein n=1 Tax=Zophobas morio TaxID=2755281 RepID=A0AA38HK05_9CUCU|nr:hypothetical protein Zmor_027053 [Zophobas morio]